MSARPRALPSFPRRRESIFPGFMGGGGQRWLGTTLPRAKGDSPNIYESLGAVYKECGMDSRRRGNDG